MEDRGSIRFREVIHGNDDVGFDENPVFEDFGILLGIAMKGLGLLTGVDLDHFSGIQLNGRARLLHEGGAPGDDIRVAEQIACAGNIVDQILDAKCLVSEEMIEEIRSRMGLAGSGLNAEKFVEFSVDNFQACRRQEICQYRPADRRRLQEDRIPIVGRTESRQ